MLNFWKPRWRVSLSIDFGLRIEFPETEPGFTIIPGLWKFRTNDFLLIEENDYVGVQLDGQPAAFRMKYVVRLSKEVTLTNRYYSRDRVTYRWCVRFLPNGLPTEYLNHPVFELALATGMLGTSDVPITSADVRAHVRRGFDVLLDKLEPGPL